MPFIQFTHTHYNLDLLINNSRRDFSLTIPLYSEILYCFSTCSPSHALHFTVSHSLLNASTSTPIRLSSFRAQRAHSTLFFFIITFSFCSINMVSNHDFLLYSEIPDIQQQSQHAWQSFHYWSRFSNFKSQVIYVVVKSEFKVWIEETILSVLIHWQCLLCFLF